MDFSLQLSAAGLTQSESVVYATLLRTGTCRTGKLLSESKLNSGKIYEILGSLKTKGLVSESIINDVRHFTASPPEQLLSYIDAKKDALERNRQELQQALPALGALRCATTPQKTTLLYTGFRGIVTAAEELLSHLKPGSEIRSLGISDVNAWSQGYWNKWEKLRQKKKIRARYVLSEKGVIYKDLQNEQGVEVRILKATTPVGIDIYGDDAILLLHYQEPVSCTVIYDEHTVKTFKAYFEVLWNVAKK